MSDDTITVPDIRAASDIAPRRRRRDETRKPWTPCREGLRRRQTSFDEGRPPPSYRTGEC